MSFALKNMCRGQGRTYLQVQMTAESSKPSIVVKSEDGVTLPSEAYWIAQDIAVIVTPLLDTKCIVLSVTDTDGSVIWSKSVSRSRVKWNSRFLYRADSDQAYELRDIDRFAFSNQIHINPTYVEMCSRDNTFLVKGNFRCPLSCGTVSLILIDGLGNRCDEFASLIQKPSCIQEEGLERLEIPFSVRIPNDGGTYCLVASSDNGCKSAFMCFDAASRDFYVEKFSSPFFRFANSDDWAKHAGAHEKIMKLADPLQYRVESDVKFSVVVPLYNTPAKLLSEMVDSVLGQFYPNWELILVNSTTDNADLANAIACYNDDRIKVVELGENLGISENTNKGIEAAVGDYIVYFDHDDVLDPDALRQYALAIARDPKIDALYCDEDNLDENGKHANPHFKSDFNIDLLRCHNYITHLLAVKATYAKELLLRREFDGAQDYDFLLRLVDRTRNIFHVPQVLYHWRMSATSVAADPGNKSYAEDAGRRALEEHLVRNGLKASVTSSHVPFLYRTSYGVEGAPLVSIIIPNKDSAEMLRRCIESVEHVSTYTNFEIVVVENNSVEDGAFAYYAELESAFANVHVVKWTDEFNYSKINNFGVSYASGDYLLLLNNDVEVITPNWIESMLGFCQREDVGVVGVKLLYPDDSIQHAGVGMPYCDPCDMGGPVHVFCNYDKGNDGYMHRAAFSQDVNIVTAACLMTKRSVFEAVGGLTERYAVAYNDVDFCLKIRSLGKLVVYDADAVLYHYESFSRGSDTCGKKKERFMAEQGKLRADWPEYFANGDRYYTRYVI